MEVRVNSETVKARLIEVLESIQHDSGYAGELITGSTCPLDDLEGFDTKISPVAIELLAQATGIPISNRNNIFVTSDGRQRLTIDQIAVGVSKLAVSAA